MKPFRISLVHAASAVALVSSPSVRAANGTWNVDAGGNWSLGTNWLGGTIADASGSTANFTFNITGDRTVTLDSSRTLTGLVFTDTGTASHNWTLARSGSAVLTLAGTSPSINVTNRTATISGVIGGSTAWTKSGAGTLTLSGANTFTGNIAHTAGVFASAMGNGNATSGPLGIFTGGTGYKTITITNNAVFRPTANYNVNAPTAALPGNGYVFSISTGGATFDTPTGVTFTIDDGSGSGTATTATQLQGSGNLTKTGAGTLSLGNAAASNAVFTGQILVNAGVLKLGAVTAAGVALGSTSAGTVIASGAGFDINNNAGTSAEPLSINGSGVGGTGNVIFTSHATGGSFSGPITLDGNSTIGSTTDGTMTFTGTSTFDLGSNALTIRNTGAGRVFTDGIISGTGSLVMNSSGTGDYVPRADHTYSGGSTLTAGFVAVDRDSIGAPGSPTSGPFGTGTLNLAGSRIRSGTGPVAGRSIGNTVTVSADTTFYTSVSEKNLTFSGPVTLSGGNRTLTSEVGTTVVTASVIFSGGIGDGGNNLSLTKAGSGNLTLTGSNTYSGGTTVASGSLILGSSASLPGFDTNGKYSVATGATLAAANTFSDADITTILGTTNFAAGSNIGFDTSDGNRTYANALTNTAQGALGLRKLGNNTLTLTGANTYTGSTSVLTGTLVASSAAALPGFASNGGFSVASGATLAVGNGVTDGEIESILGTTNFAVGSSLGFDTSSGDRTSGAILANTSVGALNLVKFGSNTLTLTGANTYTGTTTVAAGTLVAAGGSAAAGNIVVGNSTDNAVLNVPTGGTMTGGTITAGTANGSFGAVNVTGGTLTLATVDASTDAISFGGGEGAYGAFTISGGTFTQQRFMFGGIGTATTLGGVGVGLITNGTVNSAGWLILARHGASTGILTINGGLLNHAGASNDIAIGLNGSGRAELNVNGGLIDNTGRRVTFSGGTGGGFHWSGTGVVNLNGGTLLTNSVTYDSTTSPFSPNAKSYFNFGGGTLKAATSSGVFFPAHAPTGTGVSQVFVNGAFGSFAGGAVIDTNGFDSTVSANFLAPTGNGVTALSLDNAGSGYIGAPAVKILDDGQPSTATAYAVVGTDASVPATFGKVTSVVITNPGVIVGTPTVSLVGGGGTGAAVSVASTGPNTSGGLTKTGAGELFLTGNSTYTGLTSVTGGTLTVSGTGTLAASSGLSVGSGASFNYTPAVPATTLSFGAGSTLNLANNSTIGGSYESTIAVSGGATTTGTVNLSLSGAFTSGNTYTVLTAASGLDAATYKVLNASNFTYTLSATPTAVTVTPTTVAALTSAHWLGGFAGQPAVWSVSDGSTASNWTTDGVGTATALVPGVDANVFFSDASASPANQVGMSLGSDMSVGSLTFNSTSPVSLLNTDVSVLTIANGLTIGASAGPVTLAANLAIGNAQSWLNNSAQPLTTGRVTNGANLLTLTGSGTTTIGNFVGGTGGLTVDSSGGATLTSANLAGAQTWTNNSPTPLAVGTISNAGFALTLGGTGDTNVTGVVSGAGALVKSGAGTAILAANTYTGATTVSEGTLTLSGSRAGASGALSVSNVAGLSGTLNITAGTFALGGNSMNVGNAPTTGATGTVNQTGGAISFTGGNALLVGQNTVGNQGVYNLSGGSLTTFTSGTRGVMLGVNSNPTPGPASGGGTFNLSGTGALNMTAASGGLGNAILQIGRSDAAANNTTNAFNQTGGTASVGILAMGGAAGGSTGVSSTLSLTGGTFSANSFTVLAAGDTNDATIHIGGTADVTLPAFPTARGASSTVTLTLDGGTLRPTAASATYISGLNNAFIKAGGANFEVLTGRNITISQALLTDTLSTGGGLSVSGGGVVTLSGANTYTGNTSVTGGGLIVKTLASLPGISTLHKVSLSGAAALTLNVGGVGEFTATDLDAVLTNADLNTGTTLGLDTANATGGSFTYAGNITNTTGVAGTSLALTKLGANTLVLTGTNTYSGPTILAGVVQVAGDGQLGDGSATNTLTLGGTLITTGNLTLTPTRNFTLTAASGLRAETGATLTVDSNIASGANAIDLTGAGNIVVNGVIGTGATPTGGLTIGSSTLPANVTLNGNNLFTGNVSLPASNTQPFAVLTLTNSGSLGVGPKTVTATGGGEIHLQNNITLAANINFTTSGSSQQNGVGGVNRPVISNDSGNNTINGNITMASGNGSTIIESVSGLLTFNGNFAANTTNRQLQIRGNGNGVINGIISNGSTVNLPVLKDAGTGTWTFNGANTYSGATTISAGTLLLGNAAALGTGAATVNGGRLDLGGQTIANAVTVNATGTLTGSGTLSVAANLSGTVTPGGSGNGLITVASATVASTANLALQLGGTGTRGAAYDAITVNSALALDGTITVTLNGLVPAAAQTFDLIDSTGAIDVTNFNVNSDLVLPALDPGLAWDTSNFATNGQITVVVFVDPFIGWATTNSVVGGKGGDDDGDGTLNLLEFATNSNPKSGASGARVYGLIHPIGGSPVMTYTVATRAGAVFAASAPPDAANQEATKDLLKYTIEATNDLTTWNSVVVTEVTGGDATAVQAAIVPALPTLDEGWEWHTFRTDDSVTGDPTDFIRLNVTDTP